MKGNLYIGAVAAAGAAIVAGSLRNVFVSGFGAQELAWLGIAVLTLLVGRLSVRLPLPHCRVSFSDAFIFLSVMVFGGDYATLTAALDGFASSSRARGTWHKRLFNTAGMAISVKLSSLVFARLLPEGGVWGAGFSTGDLLLPVAALALTQYVLNTALVSGVAALKEHASASGHLAGLVALGRHRLSRRLGGRRRRLPGGPGARGGLGVRHPAVPGNSLSHVPRLPGQAGADERRHHPGESCLS